MFNKKDQLFYNAMMFPAMLFLLVFSILPMAGLIMAFQNYSPLAGILNSPWCGLQNFIYMFQMPNVMQAFVNTLIIAGGKIVLGFVAALSFAILLNECRMATIKKPVQTLVYLPHFISWVILAGLLTTMLSLNGVVNEFLKCIGLSQIIFLTSNVWFRPICILSDTWKEYGFSAIIYIAAIANIDPALYESSSIDGANRLQRIWHVTLPCIKTTMVLMLTLSLGSVLSANFDQIFNMYNPLVYQTGDIIDTLVYRTGLVNFQFSLATAVGLLKSGVSFILIVVSYTLAYKFSDYTIF
jgi:putative aldouronate transport system permease protein